MKEDFMCPPSPLQGSSGKQGPRSQHAAMKRIEEIVSWLEWRSQIAAGNDNADACQAFADAASIINRLVSGLTFIEQVGGTHGVAWCAIQARGARLDLDYDMYPETGHSSTEPHSGLPQTENTTFPRSGAAVTEGNTINQQSASSADPI